MFKILGLLASCLFLCPVHAGISLIEVGQFGKNQGDLKMFYYAPQALSEKAPLVVLLHGCTQSAAEFDDETGWTKLADANGFYLLLPQQKEVNNQSRCFNWFEPKDTTRENGEASSIMEMVELMQKNFNIDGRRVYIAGLSAGAAMTSVMLATYPENFAAGAIIAGIPYGCATNSMNAWACMYAAAYPIPSAQARGDAVRNASGKYTGQWPSVMIVHGTSDELVSFKNAQFHIDQWTNVHGTDAVVDATSKLDSQKYQEFKSGNKVVVSLLTIENSKHGYPIDPKNGCGINGKYILDVKVCGSKHIGNFFNLFK